jgi:hypothetical protein
MENHFGYRWLEIDSEKRTLSEKVLLWGFEPQSRA